MTARTRTAAIVVGLVVVAGVVAYVSLPSRHFYEPEVPSQREDYAAARGEFRTRLIRSAGSPQREVFALPAPSYVEVVEFPSHGLRLKAWLAGQQQAQQKLPAVIFLHGGFEFGAADWDMAIPYWQAGFVVMAPMLRGENG